MVVLATNLISASQPTGPQGIQGIQGIQGRQGIQGIQGASTGGGATAGQSIILSIVFG